MREIRRAIQLETGTRYRAGRPLVLRQFGTHLEIREKGRRDPMTVDYAALWEFACKLRARERDGPGKELTNG
jgi:hypothetical protein